MKMKSEGYRNKCTWNFPYIDVFYLKLKSFIVQHPDFLFPIQVAANVVWIHIRLFAALSGNKIFHQILMLIPGCALVRQLCLYIIDLNRTHSFNPK